MGVSVNVLHWAPAGLTRLLSTRVLTQFGLLSYSIYLWQQPFFRLSGKFPAIVMLAVAIGLGMASYRFVEKPARRWLNGLRFGPVRRSAACPPGTRMPRGDGIGGPAAPRPSPGSDQRKLSA